MSGDWIAGSVRAHGLAGSVGLDVATAVSASRDLDFAFDVLIASTWVRDLDTQTSLVAVERRILATLLWQLRILAGWLPAEGVEVIRSCVAWFEIRNVEDRMAHIAGAPAQASFELGRLGIISRSLQSTGSGADVRRLLAASSWGDPGAEDAYSIRIWMCHRWHRRVRDAAPELRVWADAAAWLLVLRERLARRPGAELLASVRPGLPSRWRWVSTTPWTSADLWSAEERWWAQIREEGASLLHSPVASSKPVLGALATLAATAHEIASALEIVSGGRYVEALGATS